MHNISIMVVLEGAKRQKGRKIFDEIMTGNFPNVLSNSNPTSKTLNEG